MADSGEFLDFLAQWISARPPASLLTGQFSIHNDVSSRASGVHRMDTTTRSGTHTWMCDRCGAAMIELHCKLRCDNCGFMRDCNDP